MKLKRVALHVAVVCGMVSPMGLSAYEINNHADMSERALIISTLETDRTFPSKRFRMGLRFEPLNGVRQAFPLSTDPANTSLLGPIPYCFGSVSPRDADPSRKFRVTIPTSDPYFPLQPGGGKQGIAGVRPQWKPGGETLLTIAELVRYGACYEDEEHPYAKSASHFYNPQNAGAGIGTVGGIDLVGSSSMHWMLRRGAGTTTTGTNHFGYLDARSYFYEALTDTSISSSGLPAEQRAALRKAAWGKTFQALGHIVHHLQDMGSPQHVRDDSHCNSVNGCGGLVQPGYRPSGYETYWEQRFELIRGLAQTATAPILFGLPREFWNTRTDNSLTTNNPTDAGKQDQGLALYTSTNFTSEGKDFKGLLFGTQPVARPADGLSFPAPATTFNEVNVSQLFPADSLPVVRDTLCGGTTVNCGMKFLGTATDPNARTSAFSFFSANLLVPRDPNNNTAPTYTSNGIFHQNFFTYTDAASKLIPLAVRYSAGLIDYFFRGEMQITPPTGGLYGLIDAGDTSSNCKDTCGFKKIKLKVKNATASINAVAQDMTAGTLQAVVKFSRNRCYERGFLNESSDKTPWGPTEINSCLLTLQTQADGTSVYEPLEEIVVSEPITGFNLGAGAERELTFTFATPIPINAWDVRLQTVFKGTLGQEEESVAVGTRQLSAPTPISALNTNHIAVQVGGAEKYRLLSLEEFKLSQPALSAYYNTPGLTACVTRNASGIYNGNTCGQLFGSWLGFEVKDEAGKLVAKSPTFTVPPSTTVAAVLPGQHAMVAALLDDGVSYNKSTLVTLRTGLVGTPGRIARYEGNGQVALSKLFVVRGAPTFFSSVLVVDGGVPADLLSFIRSDIVVDPLWTAAERAMQDLPDKQPRPGVTLDF
jgi:hypothetical protein